MWEINSKFQLFTFLGAIVLGVCYSLFYDFFRAWRKVNISSYIIVFLQDIFYFIICAFITFVYLLSVTNGEIRAYIIIGIILGFIATNLTISRYYLKLWVWVITIFKKAIFIISKYFYLVLEKIDVILVKITKNTLFFIKKGLKKLRRLLYNSVNN